MKHLLALCLTLALSGCAYTEDGWIFQPLQGPDYDIGDGLLFEPEEGQTFTVAATYLPVARSGRKLFSDHMDGIQATLDAEPEGLIAYSLGQKLVGREYRTVTVWVDEAAMMDFVLGEAHIAAIGDGGTIRNPDIEARVVRWEISPEELPLEWADIMERTDIDGRSVAY